MRIAGNLDRLEPQENIARQGAAEVAIPLGSERAEGRQILGEVTRIRFPIRMKVTLPYLVLALIIAMAGAYIITQLVFDTIEERFTNQLLETGKIAAEWVVKEESIVC